MEGRFSGHDVCAILSQSVWRKLHENLICRVELDVFHSTLDSHVVVAVFMCVCVCVCVCALVQLLLGNGNC